MGKNILLISNNVSFGKGMAQIPPECRPIHRKGCGEGKMRHDGWPWKEEAVSILVVTYLCSDFVVWSKYEVYSDRAAALK